MQQVNCRTIFNDVYDFVESHYNDFTYFVMDNSAKSCAVLFNIVSCNDLVEDFIDLQNFCNFLVKKYPCNFDIKCEYYVYIGDNAFYLILTIKEN